MRTTSTFAGKKNVGRMQKNWIPHSLYPQPLSPALCTMAGTTRPSRLVNIFIVAIIAIYYRNKLLTIDTDVTMPIYRSA